MMYFVAIGVIVALYFRIYHLDKFDDRLTATVLDRVLLQMVITFTWPVFLITFLYNVVWHKRTKI